MIDWPKLIRNYRRERKLTQASFAYILGVDQATVSRWERGSQIPDIPTQSKVLSLIRPDYGALSNLILAVSHAHGYLSLFRHDRVLLAASPAMRSVAREFTGTTDIDGFSHSSTSEPEEKWLIDQIFSESNLWGVGVIVAQITWKHYSTDTYWHGSTHPMHIDGSHVLLTIAEPATTSQYRGLPSMRVLYRDGRVEVINYPGRI